MNTPRKGQADAGGEVRPRSGGVRAPARRRAIGTLPLAGSKRPGGVGHVATRPDSAIEVKPSSKTWSELVWHIQTDVAIGFSVTGQMTRDTAYVRSKSGSAGKT